MFSPEQLTAMIFTKLKETAQIALGMKIIDCVVSVSHGTLGTISFHAYGCPVNQLNSHKTR